MSNATDPCVSEVRVRYPETDRMNVAWHGHYLAWFEIGRTEWMRAAGAPYRELEDSHGLFFPVVGAGARYLASARYDDRLNVETRLARLGGVRVRFDYRIVRAADGTLLATGFTEHGSVDRNGRPTRLPAELRERLREAGETT